MIGCYLIDGIGTPVSDGWVCDAVRRDQQLPRIDPLGGGSDGGVRVPPLVCTHGTWVILS